MGQDQVSGGVSVLCWLAAPVAMFYGNLQNSVIIICYASIELRNFVRLRHNVKLRGNYDKNIIGNCCK